MRVQASINLAIREDTMDAQNIRGRFGYRAFHAGTTNVVRRGDVGQRAEAIEIVGVTAAAAVSEHTDIRPATDITATATIVCVFLQINTTPPARNFPVRAAFYATCCITEGAYSADVAATAAVVGICIQIGA